jgi:hypothetical protein
MKIPSCFYGTHKKVKAEVNKLYTQIKKDKPLEEIFSKFELLDLDDYPIEYFPYKFSDGTADGMVINYPNNLIWIMRGVPFVGGHDNFILSAFSEPLDIGILRKFEKEKSYEMQLKLIPFLAKTEWGCVILNNEQADWSLSPKCIHGEFTINGKERFRCPIDPDLALPILEASAKYCDSLNSLGKRFFDQTVDGIKFTEHRLACYKALMYLGCEMEKTPCEKEAYCIITEAENVSYDGCKTSNDFDKKRLKYVRNGDIRYFKYNNVKKTCEKYSLFDRLKNDEEFRKNALEGVLYVNSVPDKNFFIRSSFGLK